MSKTTPNAMEAEGTFRNLADGAGVASHELRFEVRRTSFRFSEEKPDGKPRRLYLSLDERDGDPKGFGKALGRVFQHRDRVTLIRTAELEALRSGRAEPAAGASEAFSTAPAAEAAQSPQVGARCPSCGGLSPLDRVVADALADEVAVLVRRRVIDSRSPAADALLDYRNPPSSPRADRLAALEGRARSRPQASAESAESSVPLAALLREARTTLEHAQQQIPVRCSIETQVGFSCDVMDEIEATLARIDAALARCDSTAAPETDWTPRDD